MKILSDWVEVAPGLLGQAVELTEEEKAATIPLMEYLQRLKSNPSENKELCESKQDK
jgi:hypothetical protein